MKTLSEVFKRQQEVTADYLNKKYLYVLSVKHEDESFLWIGRSTINNLTNLYNRKPIHEYWNDMLEAKLPATLSILAEVTDEDSLITTYIMQKYHSQNWLNTRSKVYEFTEQQINKFEKILSIREIVKFEFELGTTHIKAYSKDVDKTVEWMAYQGIVNYSKQHVHAGKTVYEFTEQMV